MKLVNREASQKSNLLLFGRRFLNESGLSKTLFPTKIIFIGGHFTCRSGTILSNLAVLACHLQVQVKGGVSNYVPGQHGPNSRSKCQNTVCNQLKNKTSFSYGLGEKNLVHTNTKVKKELSVSTSCSFWNVVWITLFTVLDLRLLVVNINSLTTVLMENALISLHTV